MYELPYIPDTRVYRAVKGALSWMNDGKDYYEATAYYASRYKVSTSEVRKYVYMAINGVPERTYHYYAIEYVSDEKRASNFGLSNTCYTVKKAISAANAYALVAESVPNCWFGKTRRYKNEENAIKCIQKWQESARKQKENDGVD